MVLTTNQEKRRARIRLLTNQVNELIGDLTTENARKGYVIARELAGLFRAEMEFTQARPSERSELTRMFVRTDRPKPKA